MSWSAGTYTRFGGATKWGDDRDASVEIEAGIHDSHDEDLAAGINACLNKDGSNAATGDLNLGTNKITNVGDPSSAQDAATKNYVDTSASIVYATGDELLWRSTVNPYTLPTGWTRVAQNDKALRIVSGSGALSSGGANAFTTVFGSGKTTADESSHTHTFTTGTANGGATAIAGSGATTATPDHTHSGTTNAGAAHHHSLTMNLNYYDMNVIEKS